MNKQNIFPTGSNFLSYLVCWLHLTDILWICWSWFSPVCCWKQTWEWRFKNRSLLPLLLLLLRLLLISEFFFDSTRIEITEKQTEKSPQKADILMDAEERRATEWVYSHRPTVLSPPLSLPPSWEPLWPALTCCRRLGAPSPMGAIGSQPMMKCLCSFLRFPVAIVMLLSLFVHNKLHQLKGSWRAMKRQIKRTRRVERRDGKREINQKDVASRTGLL